MYSMWLLKYFVWAVKELFCKQALDGPVTILMLSMHFVLFSWSSQNISSISSSVWCSSVRPSGSPCVSTCHCWLITCGGESLTYTHSPWVEICVVRSGLSERVAAVMQVYEPTRDELPRTLRPNNHHERRHPGVLSKRRLVQTGFLPAVILLLSLWVQTLYFYYKQSSVSCRGKGLSGNNHLPRFCQKGTKSIC